MNASREVTHPSWSAAMSLLHHLGHNGTLWASAQEDRPCPEGAACYKASQVSASRTQHNLQLDPFPCKTLIFPERVLWQRTQGACGASARPPHRFPCFGACRQVGRQLLTISVRSISGPQTGRSEPPRCLPTGNLPWPRAGISCSKTGLMSVIANLWPFLHVLCFF